MLLQARLVWREMQRVGWLAYLANIEAGKRLLQYFINRSFDSIVAIFYSPGK